MEPRVVKPPGQDLAVERLKSRYGLGGPFLAEFDFSDFKQAKCKRRSPISPDGFDTYSSGDKAGSSLRCYPEESKYCRTPLTGSFKHLNMNCLDDYLESSRNLKQLETEELIENDHRVSTSKINKQSFKETKKDGIPTSKFSPVNFTEYFNEACDSQFKHTASPTTKGSNKQRLLPHQISQIYDELYLIHQKLQSETAVQQEFAEELQKRECFLVEREQLLYRHENALSKIKGVKDEVLTRFRIIKEQHDAEVQQLAEVLKEKKKESKRLRSSFDALKELNDNLKKQLNEVSEENKKMELQAKRVQARLDNLQRKYEFMTVQRMKGISHAAHEIKSLKQEKVPVSKSCSKVPLNAQVYELLTVFMDWISDHHLSRPKTEESGMDNEKSQLSFASQITSSIQEKCVKLLPMMTEQLQWMPFVNVKFHEPFVKFIYWSLRQLDAGTQHSTMTSTLRRLGEDIFKGIVTKGIQDNSVESKPKLAVFFKSSELPLRFLSTLIVLKTVTQESLKPFLEACSTTLFFRTCSVLLRTPKLDLQILEKLSIILQKLSKIKSNKKLFELFTIHLMLQELQRTTHPEHAFLCINLNSTLFNLGLTKCNSLASNACH
ncbi:coiled-coil domain-containing protein 138 isoform X2 [Suncus etruscus]|uniref:coiled-coil domain-containing protein 138 isoform X2 n=1 Tax=Suncus etruscus TaxID=109475 RepID=UPI0021109587|nr:coiled-coil domain-containing protein 138 isoform X2 [Suncus etruscus]